LRVRPPPTQYTTDANLRARQRLWEVSPSRPPFSLYPWVLELARLRGGEAVLEVGCGNGPYLEKVRAVGLDLSVGMLDAARHRAKGPLVAGDVVALPFDRGCFDVVLAPHMLYHVEERVSAVRELRRVLRPGGVCIAVTNGEENHRELGALLEAVVGHGWSWRTPATAGFSLENGADQLRSAFASVERVDCPSVVVTVTDARVLADYIASVGDHYEAEVAEWGSWAEIVEECRRRATDVIDREGAFGISKSVGAFVCR
jgi:SAM-dependent methyltransferase